MKKRRFIVIAATLALLLTAGCAAGTSNAPGESAASTDKQRKIQVVATIFPPYDFARAAAGGKANLTMLIKPGAEVHSFDPSAADILAIQNADVFFYIGGESDVWVDSILDSLDISGKQIVRLMDFVTPVAEDQSLEEAQDGHAHADEESQQHELAAPHEHEVKDDHDGKASHKHVHEEDHEDEHIWTSPKNALLMLDAVTEALCKADTANADAYRENAAAYRLDIQKIDDAFEQIATAAQNKTIVFADRFPFRYFTEAYGLTYHAALSGCSAETEVSAGTLAGLIDTVRDEGIPYVYYIELSNQNIARTISEQTGAGMLLLHSCQTLSREDFLAGTTYVSLMSRNVESLRKGML